MGLRTFAYSCKRTGWATSGSTILTFICSPFPVQTPQGPPLGLGSFGVGGVLSTLGKASLASAAFGLPLYFAAEFLHGRLPLHGKWEAVLLLTVGACLGGWAYYGLSKLMDMPERRFVTRALGRKEAISEYEESLSQIEEGLPGPPEG